MAEYNTIQEEIRHEEGTGVPMEQNGPSEAPGMFSNITHPPSEQETPTDFPEDMSDKTKWMDKPCVADQLTDPKYRTTFKVKEVCCQVLDLEQNDDMVEYRRILNLAVGPWKAVHIISDEFPVPGFKTVIKYIQYEFYNILPKAIAKKQ